MDRSRASAISAAASLCYRGLLIAAAVTFIVPGSVPGAGSAQARGRGAAQLGEPACGARPADRHLQEAWPRTRAPVHARERRDHAGGDRRQRRRKPAWAPTAPWARSPRERLCARSAMRRPAPMISIGYVRADSPIRSIKDAVGKTIAFSTAGSSTNVIGARADQGIQVWRSSRPRPAVPLTR